MFLEVGAGVAFDEYPRGDALSAVLSPFGSPYLHDYVQVCPLWAVGRGITIVVRV